MKKLAELKEEINREFSGKPVEYLRKQISVEKLKKAVAVKNTQAAQSAWQANGTPGNNEEYFKVQRTEIECHVRVNLMKEALAAEVLKREA